MEVLFDYTTGRFSRKNVAENKILIPPPLYERVYVLHVCDVYDDGETRVALAADIISNFKCRRRVPPHVGFIDTI